ncbi:hypothetical protein BKA70DRAFT_1423105 [Coprinopsis sp. MPI-PUGE-AT-0042]|nr:hypothetical protein BKA70DRAFT_1423105 [Coprinopsis sp. MPI-PUGE-AT-0042]
MSSRTLRSTRAKKVSEASKLPAQHRQQRAKASRRNPGPEEPELLALQDGAIPTEGPLEAPCGPGTSLGIPAIEAPMAPATDMNVQIDHDLDENLAIDPMLVSEPAMDEIDTSPSDRVSHTSRLRLSNLHPIFGLVDGAGRGGSILEIARQRELEAPFNFVSDATRKYEGWVKDLLTRCESISSRTGCWLYLAIQHPNSRTPFTHFTSRKLRNEAPEQVTSIHSLASQMMAALTRADRRSKVEAEMAKVEAEKKAVEQGERADAAERRLASLEAEMEARERLLAELVARLSA